MDGGRSTSATIIPDETHFIGCRTDDLPMEYQVKLRG